MKTAGVLLTGAVVFPLAWVALTVLVILTSAEALVRAAVRLSRAWR